MEKIVILNGPSGEEAILIECLNILFPDCKIEVRSGSLHKHHYPRKEHEYDCEQDANTILTQS